MYGGMKLARAYIPYQRYTTSFSPMEALKHGTMFPELVSPYGPGWQKESGYYGF